MVHVLGIWRLLFENYGEEYPATFAKLANMFLLHTARACHDNKDNQLVREIHQGTDCLWHKFSGKEADYSGLSSLSQEVMLFLIAGQVHLVKDTTSVGHILEWVSGITEKALRGARLKPASPLSQALATAWTRCTAHLMTVEDRFVAHDRVSLTAGTEKLALWQSQFSLT